MIREIEAMICCMDGDTDKPWHVTKRDGTHLGLPSRYSPSYADDRVPSYDDNVVLYVDDDGDILAAYKAGTEPGLAHFYRDLDDDECVPTGGPVTTHILDATILMTGAEPEENLIAIHLPGQEKPTVRRFTAKHLAGGVAPAKGAAVKVRATLEAAERIVIEQIGDTLSLGPDLARPEPAPTRTVPAVGPVAGPPASELPQGVYYPSADPLYAMPKNLAEYARSIAAAHRDGVRINGIVTGPPGGGKTSFIREFASQYGHPYCKIDFGTLGSPDELLGFRDLKDGSTRTVLSLLLRAFQTPNCVIHADEINRTLTPNTNALLGLLDHTGRVWVEYLQDYVVVDPSVIFLGTANLEQGDAGTFSMNPALRSRLEYPVVVDYPRPDDEAQILVRRCRIDELTAAALVTFANEIRQLASPANPEPLDESIGTRNLISVGHLIRVGLPAGEALRCCILPRYPADGGADSQQQTVAKILQGRFG